MQLYQVGHNEKDAGNSKLYDSDYSKTPQLTQTPALIVNSPTHCPTVNTLTKPFIVIVVVSTKFSPVLVVTMFSFSSFQSPVLGFCTNFCFCVHQHRF